MQTDEIHSWNKNYVSPFGIAVLSESVELVGKVKGNKSNSLILEKHYNMYSYGLSYKYLADIYVPARDTTYLEVTYWKGGMNIFQLWGDTVNTASRMESSGEAGKINISGSTYALVKDQFNCIHRGKISAKNKGEIDMYFVEGEEWQNRSNIDGVILNYIRFTLDIKEGTSVTRL